MASITTQGSDERFPHTTTTDISDVDVPEDSTMEKGASINVNSSPNPIIMYQIPRFGVEARLHDIQISRAVLSNAALERVSLGLRRPVNYPSTPLPSEARNCGQTSFTMNQHSQHSFQVRNH